MYYICNTILFNEFVTLREFEKVKWGTEKERDKVGSGRIIYKANFDSCQISSFLVVSQVKTVARRVLGVFLSFGRHRRPCLCVYIYNMLFNCFYLIYIPSSMLLRKT